MIQHPRISHAGSLLLFVSAALALLSEPRPEPLLTGVDVLAAENFAPLAGKRVALITNHPGRNRAGESTIDVLARAPGVHLVALFAPEHGLRGTIENAEVPAGRDARTGLPIHSLYAATRRPTDTMLAGLDALVFDIQDAGVRFYTYITTMGYALEEAARRGIAFFVLDRPNPLGGRAVQGPLLDADRLSFVGYFPLPIRHGMTVGELARMFNRENGLDAQLTVVPMRGWRRAFWFDQTGWEWVRPSPNLRSLAGATLYPAVELLRAGGVSVGRGTPTPFELFGAPWIRSHELEDYLEARRIVGVRFEATRFRPTADVHAGQLCHGLRLRVTDRNRLDVGRLGVELLSALWRLYPRDFQLEKTIRLLGSQRTLERIRAGDDPEAIVKGWQAELEAFKRMRARYLL
ncbi:MAG: exo-beta-N-acetylmuramidase NamZ domain-containing protein, partial [Terriglobia bacterium]